MNNAFLCSFSTGFQFYSFHLGRMWSSYKDWFSNFQFGVCSVSWKDVFWIISNLGGCVGLEGRDIGQFLPWEGLVVFKGLIFNNFRLWMIWWSWKHWVWVIFTLELCDILKGLILDNFLLRRYGSPEMTDFE